MNVSDLMNAPARTCRADESCSAAARVLWESDCGCVPVTDPNGQLVGVVTDRDLCMAAYTTGRPLDTISVARAMATVVHTCPKTASLEDAMATMRECQVHRLPVVDADGQLAGIVSLSDIVRHQARKQGTRAAPVVKTLAAIYRPRGEESVVEIAPPRSRTAARPATGAKKKAKTSRSKR